jgi:hypothetical protein
MKIRYLIGITGLLVTGIGNLEAYSWTVHNVTSSPAEVKLRLLGCLAHDPKQTIAPGEQYQFDVGGWSFGCCLKTDGLEINGKTIKHIDYETIAKRHPKLAKVVDNIISMPSKIGTDKTVALGGETAVISALMPPLGALLLAGLVGSGITGLSMWIVDKIKSTCSDSDFVVSEDGEGGFIAIQKPKSKK